MHIMRSRIPQAAAVSAEGCHRLRRNTLLALVQQAWAGRQGGSRC